MSLFLKIVLITYIVIAYIAAVLMVLAIRNFSTKMKKQGQPAIKVSMGRIIPIAILAPISLPIVLIVSYIFKKKKGM